MVIAVVVMVVLMMRADKLPVPSLSLLLSP